MKTVSLLPSGTEILCSLGIEPKGISHLCDYPPEITDKPVLTQTNISGDNLTTNEINEQVYAEKMRDGVYSIKDDLLEEIDPDVIITQDICDVCAADTPDVQKALERTNIDAEIVSLHPHCLDDILQEIRTVGEALNQTDKANQVVQNLENRITNLRDKTTNLENPTVTTIEWMDPVILAGHWAPELVEIAGGEYIGCNPGEPSRKVEWSEVLDLDPDKLVVSPCGFTVTQTTSNLSDLATNEEWNTLTSVRNNDLYVMDGHSYMNRPGPRIVDSAEFIAMALNPEEFGEPPGDVVQKPIKIR